MKYYFIAGEASGDLHGSNCMREIQKLDEDAAFAFTGGDLMEAVSNVKPGIHIKQMAFMGFVDVLKNIRTIKKNFKIVKEEILKFKPDLLVLVDYPGFNLRMAKWATQQGIRVDYYISPTVWAWKEGRVEEIRKYTHKLFVILPFEEAFYQKHNHKVYFTGHPLIDAIEQQKQKFKSKELFIKVNELSGKPIIAVLPGSRVQEIERMLKIMLEVTNDFKEYEFVVAGTTNLPISHYDSLKKHKIKVVFNQTYELMSYAKAGIIKSGTSTLESALFKLPQVVCYKAGSLSFAIGKRLVNVKYISLVNLIMDKLIVKELIQQDFTSKNISEELKRLLEDQFYKNNMIAEYTELTKQLGGVGASERIAKHLVLDASEKK
ncbi:lipid-A-disaccharide synthase [Aurantibacillus circumpalustris]|uniref:lipid-A-disaccharide synthase n=1 Tax=Aurantibacillus circumpalustris TaxID=3036359 RepID=UPI00295BE4A5|nr:lipid-A-disaccharide synthase [Aurantibacillus circumpalustris]